MELSHEPYKKYKANNDAQFKNSLMSQSEDCLYVYNFNNTGTLFA